MYPNRKLFLSLTCLLLIPTVGFALDVVDTNFSPQSATSVGSNGSTISFSTGGSMTGTTSYINENNDSTTIGNYLRGYYYDSVFGFFQLDWNTSDTTQNVRIVSSTDKCATGYGYKFGGYAKNDYAGFINFDYNKDIFVYYCESDRKLHGYAYSTQNGFQSFEGIGFDAVVLSKNTATTGGGSNDPFFVNNNSLILMQLQSNQADIQGENVASKQGKETIFYIVK